jgi:hypothetical protein
MDWGAPRVPTAREGLSGYPGVRASPWLTSLGPLRLASASTFPRRGGDLEIATTADQEGGATAYFAGCEVMRSERNKSVFANPLWRQELRRAQDGAPDVADWTDAHFLLFS